MTEQPLDTFQILCCETQPLGAIIKKPKSLVALTTEKPTDAACLMVVIYSEPQTRRLLGKVANCTHPRLSTVKLFVIPDREVIQFPQHMLAAVCRQLSLVTSHVN